MFSLMMQLNLKKTSVGLLIIDILTTYIIIKITNYKHVAGLRSLKTNYPRHTQDLLQ
jgi:hypothetical protein